MKPLTVFIDTSSLPRNPGRLGVKFERLCQLAQSKLVKVFLSEVVIKEWETQLEEDFSEKIRQSLNCLETVNSHPWLSAIHDHNLVKKAKDVLSISQEAITEIAKNKVSEILARLGAQVLPIKDGQGKIIMTNYFDGLPPFQHVKNREDIPDAFIFQCAKELAAKVKTQIYCIISDKFLNSSLSSIEGMTVFNNIHDFVKSSEVEEIVKQREMEINWRLNYEHVVQVIQKSSEELKDKLDSLIVDELANTFVLHSGIPSDDNEAYIDSVGEIEEINLEWGEIEDFGPGVLLVPFNLKCEVNVEFPIYHSDAYCMPEEVHVHIGDHEEDKYFEASGDLEIYVEGNLSIYIDLNKFEKTGEILIDNVKIDETKAKEVLAEREGAIFR